jgi:S-formylglutathione hydrolase FrmB
MNATGKPKDRYEDYLAEDLIRDVEAKFPAARGRANRAIIGISMGGFAAVKLALARPELFIFAGGMSSAIDVTRRRFSFKHARLWWRLRAIFGPWESTARLSADPYLLAQSAEPAATSYLYLTAGEQEPLMTPNLQFAELLSERQFLYEFYRSPGGHNWEEWNQQIEGCFAKLLQHLNPAG